MLLARTHPPIRALLLALAVCAGPAGCSDEEGGAASDRKPPQGSAPNLERWVVHFEGEGPDLGEYRKALKESPDAVPGLVAGLREKAKRDRADFATKVEALGGRIVDHWWMTNAVTIEIEPSGLPTIRKTEGVQRVEPDRLLE